MRAHVIAQVAYFKFYLFQDNVYLNRRNSHTGPVKGFNTVQLIHYSPVQMRHHSFRDVPSSLLKDSDYLTGGVAVPARVDNNRTSQLCLSMCSGTQYFLFALCDWPSCADLSNHATADICAISAV